MQSKMITLARGLRARLITLDAVVIGSGAAGLACCERLHGHGVTDIALVTNYLGGGTSNLSGSDKQTYYKMGISGRDSDSPLEFAETLTAGGMMHGDLAYIEGVLSPMAFFHLAEAGVPFPHDRMGTYVGYKTDHDPRQRATSAGPKTSHDMVQCLLRRVKANQTPIFDKHALVAFLTGPKKEVIGLICIDRKAQSETDPGLVIFNCANTVLATGGPGELYKISVYPHGQAGAHGAALKIGAEANNLSESQFGLASTQFRWNLSGTYQQVIPHYFSTDKNGKDERNFLPEYFHTMSGLASAIFLKGYQWPFHAQYTANMGSSIIDIAVNNEIMAGRRVFMDFMRNPQPANGLKPFDIKKLQPEAIQYLARSGAMQKTPYARLQHMNPESIALYAEHKVDLKKPLEVAVCFQHNNGGLTGDVWWQSSVKRLFVIGETCGSHGVRPGGSALNSGQVGAIRAAEYIARHANASPLAEKTFINTIRSQALAEWDDIQTHLQADSHAPTVTTVRREIQNRMSNTAAFIRDPEKVIAALAEARTMWQRMQKSGQRLTNPAQLWKAVENQQLCLTHLAFLENIHALIERGGGSRGSYMILDPQSRRMVETRRGKELPHRPENAALRNEVMTVRYDTRKKRFTVTPTPVRPLPTCDAWYETTWADYKKGRIFE